MQVVAFQCPQVFNEVIFKSKVHISSSYGICAIHESCKCETLFNYERLRSCQVLDSIGICNNLKFGLENLKIMFDILPSILLTFCKMMSLLSLWFMDCLNKDWPCWINPIDNYIEAFINYPIHYEIDVIS
jgi:hypothetical protein